MSATSASRSTTFPSDEVEKQMELDTPFDLLGLYQGVSMMERGAGHVANDIDRIFLYRRPILDYWCESGEDLPHIVRHVLIHEIGHHFGLSDDDMEAIEAKAEEESSAPSRAASAEGCETSPRAQ